VAGSSRALHGPLANQCCALLRALSESTAPWIPSGMSKQRRTQLFLFLLASCARYLATANAGTCPANLQYLDSRLPRYNDATLVQMRNMALGTDIQQALSTARSQGYSPQQAAAATLAQARAAEQAMPAAEQCVRQASSDPDAVLAAIRAGTYVASGSSVTGSCMRAYVLAYYQWILNKEAAVALACWASAGSTRSSGAETAPQPLTGQQVEAQLGRCLNTCEGAEASCKRSCGPDVSTRKDGESFGQFKQEVETKYACRSACVDTYDSCTSRCR
jgi:hypothetical protein